jgi:hypothetical protein
MGTSEWIALGTAIIAGLVALIGYLVTQLANRNERKRRFYAEALASVREYQELPYRIRRRPSSNAVTRFELSQVQSDIMAKLGFYHAWLQIDSAEVGSAYSHLLDQVRHLGRIHRASAWRMPIFATDEQMADDPVDFRWDIQPELDRCLRAMRRELSFWPLPSRRSIERSLAAQHQVRTQERGER